MSNVESVSAEPKAKRELNPIMKSMNDFRNNVIGTHIGSKAPVKTAPIFKLTIAAARLEMGLEEGAKNTIEVVEKASSLFQEEPDKYTALAASQPPPEKKSTKTSKVATEGKTKSKKTSKAVSEKASDDSDGKSKSGKTSKTASAKSSDKKVDKKSKSKSKDEIVDSEDEDSD